MVTYFPPQRLELNPKALSHDLVQNTLSTTGDDAYESWMVNLSFEIAQRNRAPPGKVNGTLSRYKSIFEGISSCQ